MQRLNRTPRFCYFHGECPKCIRLWRFGLDIPLDGILVTIFVSHSFSNFNDLKLGNIYYLCVLEVGWESVISLPSEVVRGSLLMLSKILPVFKLAVHFASGSALMRTACLP